MRQADHRRNQNDGLHGGADVREQSVSHSCNLRMLCRGSGGDARAIDEEAGIAI